MNLILGVYALLLLIGGFIGHYQAGSTASLVTGTIFGLLFFVLAFQKSKIADYFSMGLTLLLIGFFGYRLALTGKFFPAGFMVLVSALLFLWLLRLTCSHKRVQG